MIDLTPWLRAWQRAKDTEDEAKEMRLEAEREIIAALGKPDNFKGTAHLDGVSVSFGESVKVDGDALTSIVKSGAITKQEAAYLFRSKLELVAKAWKEAPEYIKRELSGALEIKPSKPAFTRVTKTTEKKESK
jgi:hypothetical protein